MQPDFAQWCLNISSSNILKVVFNLNLQIRYAILTCLFWSHKSKSKFRTGCILSYCIPQTREQTLGGTLLWYEKSILGCWLWVRLGCGIKGLGRLWATFEGGFFNFLWENKTKQIFFENIVASALKSCIEKR